VRRGADRAVDRAVDEPLDALGAVAPGVRDRRTSARSRRSCSSSRRSRSHRLSRSSTTTPTVRVRRAGSEGAPAGRSAGTNRPGPARSYPVEDWDALFAVNVRATFPRLPRRWRRAAGARCGRIGRQPLLADGHRSATRPRGVLCDEARGRGADKGARRRVGAARRACQSGRADVRQDPAHAADVREPEFHAEVQRRLPTRELATVEQVADAVRYLACDASGSVTGSILRVDGGWTAW
jgi:Enoyl-(Acyl carrier protein) reductase